MLVALRKEEAERVLGFSFYEASIIIIPKLDRHFKKRKLHTNVSYEHEEALNKILANPIQ